MREMIAFLKYLKHLNPRSAVDSSECCETGGERGTMWVNSRGVPFDHRVFHSYAASSVAAKGAVAVALVLELAFGARAGAGLSSA